METFVRAVGCQKKAVAQIQLARGQSLMNSASWICYAKKKEVQVSPFAYPPPFSDIGSVVGYCGSISEGLSTTEITAIKSVIAAIPSVSSLLPTLSTVEQPKVVWSLRPELLAKLPIDLIMKLPKKLIAELHPDLIIAKLDPEFIITLPTVSPQVKKYYRLEKLKVLPSYELDNYQGAYDGTDDSEVAARPGLTTRGWPELATTSYKNDLASKSTPEYLETKTELNNILQGVKVVKAKVVKAKVVKAKVVKAKVASVDRRCRKVVIFGLVYDSVKSAAIKLNVHRSTLTNWLKNPNKPDYHYLEP